MGAGKTYWGAKLASVAGFPFYDLDQAIEQHSSKTISQLFEETGEEGFRKVEQEVLRSIALQQDKFVMACGGGTPCFFDNLELMKQLGVVVWIKPSPVTIKERLLTEKTTRPLICHLNEKQLDHFIQEKMEAREPYYRQAHLVIDGEETDAVLVFKKIIDA